MSWIKTPTKLRTETFRISDLWVELFSSTRHRYAYLFDDGSNADKYVITEDYIGFKLKVDSTVLEPVYADFNGNIYFQGGNYLLFYSGSVLPIVGTTTCGGWVLMEGSSSANVGYIPIAWENEETQAVEGDAWWSGGNLPTSGTVDFSPFGTAFGTKTVEFYMPRWEKTAAGVSGDRLTDNVLGTYSDPDGINDDLFVGSRFWAKSTSADTYFEQSITKTNDHFTYGEIHWNAAHSVWILGEYGSSAGWYEGSEPNIENDVTFTFQNGNKPNFSLHYRGFRMSEKESSTLLGEAAIWR